MIAEKMTIVNKMMIAHIYPSDQSHGLPIHSHFVDRQN